MGLGGGTGVLTQSSVELRYESFQRSQLRSFVLAVSEAIRIANQSGLKIGQIVGHPSCDIVGKLHAVDKSGMATVKFPKDSTCTNLKVPLNELYDPNDARRLAVLIHLSAA